MASCIESYLWSRAEPRAEQLAVDALRRGRDLGDAGSPAYLRVRHMLGWAIREQDRYDKAAEILQEVLECQEALPGGAATDALRTRHDLAWTLGRLGRWGEAEAQLRRVLGAWRALRESYGQHDDDAFTLHTRCKMYWCINKQGLSGEAEREYRQLLHDRGAVLGADHADSLDTLESLGKTLAWQGKWTDAQLRFQSLAAGRVRTLGERHPDTLLAHQLATYAAGYQAGLNNDVEGLQNAIVRLEEILREQLSARGAEHRNTRETRACLAALREPYPPESRWIDDLPRPAADFR
jgi:tetratricopeptide (TPR) repeat protein